MKETINVSIGNQAFTLDVDAHILLKGYLNDVNDNIPNCDRESMFDIESRISEIIREKLPSPMMVVTIEMVRDVMKVMGTPSDFSQTQSHNNDNSESQDKNPRKLYRSRKNCAIAGVCGGVANYFGLEIEPLRIATLLLLLFGGVSIFMYIIFWIVVPLAPQELNQQ